MALSDERIEELILAGGGRWHDKSFWKIEDADLHPTARAIEAEVRKQDETLILQMMKALEDCSADSSELLGQYQPIYSDRYRPHRLHEQERVVSDADTVLNAARARLDGKP